MVAVRKDPNPRNPFTGRNLPKVAVRKGQWDERPREPKK